MPSSLAALVLFQRAGGEVRHPDPKFRTLFSQGMRDEHTNVGAPFTQRRHIAFNHVDTVVGHQRDKR